MVTGAREGEQQCPRLLGMLPVPWSTGARRSARCGARCGGLSARRLRGRAARSGAVIKCAREGGTCAPWCARGARTTVRWSARRYAHRRLGAQPRRGGSRPRASSGSLGAQFTGSVARAHPAGRNRRPVARLPAPARAPRCRTGRLCDGLRRPACFPAEPAHLVNECGADQPDPAAALSADGDGRGSRRGGSVGELRAPPRRRGWRAFDAADARPAQSVIGALPQLDPALPLALLSTCGPDVGTSRAGLPARPHHSALTGKMPAAPPRQSHPHQPPGRVLDV